MKVLVLRGGIEIEVTDEMCIVESATVPGKWMHIYPEPSHKPVKTGRTE